MRERVKLSERRCQSDRAYFGVRVSDQHTQAGARGDDFVRHIRVTVTIKSVSIHT